MSEIENKTPVNENSQGFLSPFFFFFGSHMIQDCLPYLFETLRANKWIVTSKSNPSSFQFGIVLYGI